MVFHWRTLVFGFVLLAGVPPARAQKAVYVVRHAEKADASADPPLSPVVVPMGDPGKTFDKIRSDHPNDAILVVGHTNTIGDLIRKWDPTAAITVSETEFDKVFVVVPEGEDKASWSRFRYNADD